MQGSANVFTFPAGQPFLTSLVDALLQNRLVPGVDFRDELVVARTTIYVPTRRAARGLRGAFVERSASAAAILPTIRPLGDFDETAGHFDEQGGIDLPPAIGAMDRILSLAPLVKAWKSRLPAHVMAMFNDGEDLVVPTSTADAIWLSRDLVRLIDEVETEDIGFAGLAQIVPESLAEWWQVTLEFLKIVTRYWPEMLAEADRLNPAAHRNALIDSETLRIQDEKESGPIIGAGSTGSIPATARLLSAIARHPRGAVVLPGLDRLLDDHSWSQIDAAAALSVFGHPQFGLKKLIEAIGIRRDEVREIDHRSPALKARLNVITEAMRPAEATDRWVENADVLAASISAGALQGLTLLEAANEHEEALAIAIALRRAAGDPAKRVALITGDRHLARRVSSELLRFGVRADDSGGFPLTSSPAAVLLRLIAEAAFRPADPAVLLDLFAHPLFLIGREPQVARRVGALLELSLLRGQTTRHDIFCLRNALARRLNELEQDRHAPLWLERVLDSEWLELQNALDLVGEAFAPLQALTGEAEVDFADFVRRLVTTFEILGRDHDGNLDRLYAGDAGECLVEFLRSVLAANAPLPCRPAELPDVLQAMLATEIVKPSAAGDGRIAIWGALEARLQSVDLAVIGGLNEGTWPRHAETGRFMSRLLAADLGLEPPERRIGQSAHDFLMALGNEQVVLSRSARFEGAPSTPSRWLQRLLTVAGDEAVAAMRERGRELLELAQAIDVAGDVKLESQPRPKPPLSARPRRFSVTEIETLRRDPYAIYARRILRLEPLQPLGRDPSAAERGLLFHEILYRFSTLSITADDPDAAERLREIAAQCFAEAQLPIEVNAIWWPRFLKLVPGLVAWERDQAARSVRRHSEISASACPIGDTDATLSGRADRIDILEGGRTAEIIDFKTGDAPSKKQAHVLLAPQMALEGALLQFGAFAQLGPLVPEDLKFVRLKANGTVLPESILEHDRDRKTASELAALAWNQLQRLIEFYADENNGYLSRAVPLREFDTDGDYDHLARVQEWSAGFDGEEGTPGQ